MRRAALLLSSAIALSACLALEPSTPAPAPEPVNVRQAVIQVLDGADRPIEGAIVASAWNDVVLDESEPTAPDGVTSLVVADDAWVTAVLGTSRAMTVAVNPGETLVRIRVRAIRYTSFDIDVVPDEGAEIFAGSAQVGVVTTQGSLSIWNALLQRDGRATVTGRRSGFPADRWGVAVDVTEGVLAPLVLSTTFATAEITIDLLSPLAPEDSKFIYAAHTHLGAAIGPPFSSTSATSGQVTVQCADHPSRDGTWVVVSAARTAVIGTGYTADTVTIARPSSTYVAVDLSGGPPRFESLTADRTPDGRPRFAWTAVAQGDADALVIRSLWLTSLPGRRQWEFVLPPTTPSPVVAPPLPPSLARMFTNDGGKIGTRLEFVDSDESDGYADAWLLDRELRFELDARTRRSSIDDHYVP